MKHSVGPQNRMITQDAGFVRKTHPRVYTDLLTMTKTKKLAESLESAPPGGHAYSSLTSFT
jgi:hypothetical protein